MWGSVVAVLAATSACSLGLSGTLSEAAEDSGVAVDAGPSPPVDGGGSSVDASGAHDAAMLDAVASDGFVAVEAAPPPDGGPPSVDCDGVLCDGVCLNGGSCATCAAGHALCAGSNTCGDCSSCTGAGGVALPVACFACDSMGENPVGTCQADDVGGYCLSSVYPNGGTHCPCPNFDVASCPGDNQVCVQVDDQKPICVTCGETFYATDMAVCQANASCNATASPPRCQ
jgi:hypothetical protein